MTTLLNHDWDMMGTLDEIRSRINDVPLQPGWNYCIDNVLLIVPKYVANDQQYYVAFCWHSTEHGDIKASVIGMLTAVINSPETTHEN